MARTTEPAHKAPIAAAQAEAARDEREARNYLSALEAVENAVGLGGETRLYLARRGQGGEWEHLTAMPSDAFDLDKVKAVYGGGHYRMQVRGVGPSGKKEWLDSAVFDIGGVPKPVDAPPVAAAPTAPQESPLAMATKFTEMIMGAVTAALSAVRPAEQQNPIEILRTAKELFQPAPSITPDQLIEKWGQGLDTGLEKGMELGSSHRREDSFASVAKEFVPVVRDVVGAVTQAQHPARPVVPVQEVKTLPAGGEAAVPQEVKTLPAWLGLLWPYMNLIYNLAKAGFSPELAAAQLLEKLSDDVYEGLALDIEAGNWVNRTTALLPNPLVAQHGGWITAVLTAMEHQVKEAAAEPEEGGEGRGAP